MTTPSQSKDRAPLGFWILAAALILYVAACTLQRQNKWGADAWEHQRAVLALTRHLWKPGNPTYASDLPSVRYSPYAIGWAVVCRLTRIDPYTALSAAAVVNTALLVLGVWLLLGAFQERASAAAVLLVMVALYGGAPGFANSYALADLPWHQVNPSAFSFAFVLIGWSILRRMATRRWSAGGVTLLVVLSTVAMLDHPMTGAFGVMGLFVLAVTGPRESRARAVAVAAGVVGCVGLLCLAWPWYGFLAAVRTHQDTDYWFNRGVLVLTLTQWIAPAVLCALFTIPLRGRPLVRMCLVGGAASLAAGVTAAVVHSPVLARFPLPGLIYFHMAVGVFAHQTGVFRPSTWRVRMRTLTAPAAQASEAMVQVVLAVLTLYCLIPQLKTILTQPYLARPYLTQMLHLRNLQQHPRQTLADLLAPVGTDDVVLSDPQTSWLIPAFRGRIVAAIHYELFVPKQPLRMKAVEQFFAPDATLAQRQQVLRDYHVRWIVLDRSWIGKRVFNELLQPSAVVKRADDMVLMSAAKWTAAAH